MDRPLGYPSKIVPIRRPGKIGLPQHAVRCEGRECSVMLAELVQGSFWGKPSPVWEMHGSDSGEVEPFLIKPVVNFDNPSFPGLRLAEYSVECHRDQMHEGGIILTTFPDSINHISTLERALGAEPS